MFSSQITTLQSGTDRYILKSGQTVLNYDQVIEHLVSNELFRSFFIQTLAGSSFSAFRFETPPISRISRVQSFEFVLIDSPWLDRRQDGSPFGEFFSTAGGQEILVFDNLGGDATLVVPAPIKGETDYSHFAAFLRTASDSQKDRLVVTVAKTLSAMLSDKPTWLNTAGGGVDWLHIRLDSKPKYYAHQPYRADDF